MTKNDIIEAVKNMTILEVNDLIKSIEDEFGVTAAAPQMVMQGESTEAAEQTEFDVILASAGGSKIPVIKAVRGATGLGLKEAKALVDGAPAPVKEKIAKDEAEKLKATLEEAGATVEIK